MDFSRDSLNVVFDPRFCFSIVRRVDANDMDTYPLLESSYGQQTWEGPSRQPKNGESDFIQFFLTKKSDGKKYQSNLFIYQEKITKIRKKAIYKNDK